MYVTILACKLWKEIFSRWNKGFTLTVFSEFNFRARNTKNVGGNLKASGARVHYP